MTPQEKTEQLAQEIDRAEASGDAEAINAAWQAYEDHQPDGAWEAELKNEAALFGYEIMIREFTEMYETYHTDSLKQMFAYWTELASKRWAKVQASDFNNGDLRLANTASRRAMILGNVLADRA